MVPNDGQKLSFSERDRRRREGKSDERASEGLRSKEATAQYLRKIDQLFSGPKDEVTQLADAVRAAHGTPQLAEACRQYLDQAGAPTEPALIAMFLDARDRELTVHVLEALRDAIQAGQFEMPRSLQSPLRTLAYGTDDSVASLAEELLGGA